MIYYNNNKRSKRTLSNYKLMKIPFEKNILEYLKKIHTDNTHRGLEFMRNYILSNNIYYSFIIYYKEYIMKCNNLLYSI